MYETTSFRYAEAGDASLISKIIATSWRKAYRTLIEEDYLDRLPDHYWMQAVRTWLESGRFYGIIAYVDDEPSGVCIYGRGRDAEYADWGEIVSLYVLPEAARQGLGTGLISKALSDMREEGYHRFYLWAICGATSADAFYKSHGFRVTPDHVNYLISGEPVTDLRYVRVEEQP